MIVLTLALCALALALGTLLLLPIPLCPKSAIDSSIRCSVIIPARNEENNIARLVQSIQSDSSVAPEVIVVNDGSTDATAEVAAAAGANVITARSLPPGWIGKTWACAEGAEKANGDLLLFLDADTWFAPGGFNRLISAWKQQRGQRVALSLLPLHITYAPYEELSLFFNLLMAFGAGGFGAVGKSKLFGQCLVIPRETYYACGGYAAVRGRLLENMAMADRIESVGGRCVCLGGRGVLQMRMFPHGMAQLCESWKKAFAVGATASDRIVLALAIAWLTALCALVSLLYFAPGMLREFAIGLYLLGSAQVYWSARQVGTFRWTTALLYPIPLIFFFGLFTSSLLSRVFRREVMWRGRRI